MPAPLRHNCRCPSWTARHFVIRSPLCHCLASNPHGPVLGSRGATVGRIVLLTLLSLHNHHHQRRQQQQQQHDHWQQQQHGSLLPILILIPSCLILPPHPAPSYPTISPPH